MNHHKHQFRLLTIVTQFSNALGEMKGVHYGFTTIDAANEQFYDPDYIGTTFDSKLKFSDQNCRLTVFTLFKNQFILDEESNFKDEEDFLYGDFEG